MSERNLSALSEIRDQSQDPSRRRKEALWVAFAALGLPFSASAQTPALIDIGAYHGTAINNAGQVGVATNFSNGSGATGGIYANGTVTLLPSLPGVATPITPLAINAAGQVAGSGWTGSSCVDAVFYSNGTLTDLVIPFSDLGEACSFGNAINASGLIVGQTNPSGGSGVIAFVYDSATQAYSGIPDFPNSKLPLGEMQIANGVNDHGVITGTSQLITSTGVAQHAFSLNSNGVMTDLGPGTGFAINNAGEVAGSTPTTAGTDAFLYTGGQMLDIGTLPGGKNAQAAAINASGLVVGSSDLAASQGMHAFFYNGIMTDLNAMIAADDPLKPFVTLNAAAAINDAGLIVVNGTDSRDGKEHAYLLRGPSIFIKPNALEFSSTAVGSVSSTQLITLSNSGTQPISLDSPTIGTNFKLTNNCGTALAAGSSCTIAVSLAPTVSGDLTGSLIISAEAAPFAVALKGAGSVAVTMTASPTTVTAGTPSTLSWTLSAGATCTATGGQSGDGWSGAITAGGSRSVKEMTAGSYSYGLACTAGSQTAKAQATVQVTSAPSGGGSLDLTTLAALGALLAARKRARRIRG